ncbi:hypothetical protein DENIS_1721 [Desulfonema ishimotonii]|uniref:Kynurenine formamidase n=1 Tax=Desulfonema ishimotonii TaxID=45657 RepID=A0A401FUW4_9BACT|nr:cyclase family protein [Desulfonema ishimotonii]GBC60762.1 hypothetical protein DENIS_1721 [Desulfonema ishimotonii]
MIHQNIYDISVALGSQSIDYPGDPPFSARRRCLVSGGDMFDLSALEMSAHSGTHIDVPAHFIPGGRTIDQYTPGEFILPAQVIAIQNPDAVTPAELEPLDIRNGDALLFKTENSESGRSVSGVWSEQYVCISPEAAMMCVRKGVSLVGIDYISVDKAGDETYPVHQSLLGNGVLILEGIHLRDVPPGRYTLYCLPLRIPGGEASPVRAILVR